MDRKRKRTDRDQHEQIQLPFGARLLSSRDLPDYRALFGLYLDVQKSIDIETLDGNEIKGRFKSFLGKWNREELSRGWYDPEMKAKADDANHEPDTTAVEESDSDYGPSLGRERKRPLGPTIPQTDDLRVLDEQRLEDAEQRQDDIRHERKRERKARQQQLEELVPRAEPGTRERQLEKKRETAAEHRAFREKSAEPEVDESRLLGGGENDYKTQVQAMQRKKTDREVRKEETLRAREAERAGKLAAHRAKEDKTLDMLKALAKQRYGA